MESFYNKDDPKLKGTGENYLHHYFLEYFTKKSGNKLFYSFISLIIHKKLWYMMNILKY